MTDHLTAAAQAAALLWVPPGPLQWQRAKCIVGQHSGRPTALRTAYSCRLLQPLALELLQATAAESISIPDYVAHEQQVPLDYEGGLTTRSYAQSKLNHGCACSLLIWPV